MIIFDVARISAEARKTESADNILKLLEKFSSQSIPEIISKIIGIISGRAMAEIIDVEFPRTARLPQKEQIK